MTPWPLALATVAATGNITQCYPAFCTAGAGAGTQGELVRRPTEGTINSLTVVGDGSNAGTLELWDASGVDAGADVDTLAVVTNAQMATLVAAGKAKLIASVLIAGTDQLTVFNAGSAGAPCMKGLCARFSNAGPTGAATININATGLFQKYERHV